MSISQMKILKFRDVSYSKATVVINGRAGTGQVPSWLSMWKRGLQGSKG